MELPCFFQKLYGFMLVHLMGFWILFQQIYRFGFIKPLKKTGFVKQEAKIFIVTGAIQGIGRQVVERLLTLEAFVIITGRSASTSKRVRQALEDFAALSTRFRYVQLELESIDEIVKFCELIKTEYNGLDGLVCNAGLVYSDCTRLTRDGFEPQQTVNYLSNIVLVEKLAPLLAKRRGRVILVSSAIQCLGYCNLDDFMLAKCRSPYLGYAQSKLAQVAYTKLIARQLAGQGITINAVHPGCVATGLYGPWMTILGSSILMSAATAAETILCPLVSPDFETITGEYLEFCEVVKPHARALDINFQNELYAKSRAYLEPWLSE